MNEFAEQKKAAERCDAGEQCTKAASLYIGTEFIPK
jgi:hypothetical protein